MNGYFDQLAARLRAEGIPQDQVAVAIDDLTTYLDESGSDPEAEFGPAAEFAERLAPQRAGHDGDGTADPPEGEHWRWRADAFHEMRWLATFGDQGWEVERVDSAGRFVCRRDAQAPQRWTYRRELVRRTDLAADSATLADELAPDDWEPCGTWVCYAYFKQSKTVLLGPQAMIDDPPRQPARKSFFSRRFYLAAVAVLAGAAAAIVAAAAGLMVAGDRYVGGNFAVGVLVGVAIGVVGLLALCIFLIKRAEARADRE